MALPNPTVAPPALLYPDRRISHHRSPSHSPVRPNPREVDPILRNLSPSTTLRLFAHEPNDVNESHYLAQTPTGLDTITLAERELGVKAAQTCLYLRTWTKELEAWTWPGNFETPTNKSTAGGVELDEYWACLPSSLVEIRESRVRAISEALEELDIEELKDFALSAHNRGSASAAHNGYSTDSTRGSKVSLLADCTTLITATVLQALPFLSRLVRLLSVWNVRLLVCRKAPAYLSELYQAQQDMKQAWLSISGPNSDHVAEDNLSSDSHAAITALKVKVQKHIHRLGVCLDGVLDQLEGRDETLPDAWIDEFEEVERSYANWIVQADRRLLEIEWTRARFSIAPKPGSLQAMSSDQAALSVATVVQPTSTTSLVTTPRDGTQALPHVTPIMADFKTPYSADQHSSIAGHVTSQTFSTEAPSPHRARHIPIILDDDGDGRGYPFREMRESSNPLKRSDTNDTLEIRSESLRARSPFLNGNIEKAESLQKQAASPVVRPFEHASTAFTKLFKKVGRHANDEQEAVKALRSKSSFQQDLESLNRGRQQSLTPLSKRSQRFESESNSATRSPHSASSRRGPLVRSGSELSILVDDKTVGSGNAGSGCSANSQIFTSPKLLSSPFPSSDGLGDVPDNWPLRSPTPSSQTETPVLGYNSDSHIHPKAAVRSPIKARLHVVPKSSVQSFERPLDSQILTSARQIASSDHSNTSEPTENSSHAGSVDPRSAAFDPGTAYGNEDNGLADDDPYEQRLSEYDPPVLTRFKNREVVHDHDEALQYVKPDSVRRASYASIESHPRSAVKAIDVTRRTSYSSYLVATNPGEETLTSPVDDHSPSINEEDFEFPSPPNVRADRILDTPATIVGFPAAHGTEQAIPLSDSFDTGNKDDSSSEEPSALHVMKQRKSAKIQDESPDSPSIRKPRDAKISPEDSFDRHVSEVVQKLHTNIRFKSRPGAETPIFSRPSGARNLIAKARGNRPNLGSGHGMTIAPAEPSSKKTSTTTEPVKLYHLRQEGREEPIKLFVRLVGEDERVMVRVGGGWSDLADYLRQYADHHGSRTVSGNGFGMGPADGIESSSPTLPSAGSRLTSGAGEFTRAKTPVTPRSQVSRPGSREGFTQTAGTGHLSEQVGTGFGLDPAAGISPHSHSPMIKSVIAPTSAHTTPKSHYSRAATSNSSRPATPDSAATSGLASGKRSVGPSSDQKARWVEGMIERAKASTEQDKYRSERERVFGDMGRIGATRRVIFRSSSSTRGDSSGANSASTAAAAVAAAVAAASRTSNLHE